jgi:3-hydroxyisobutyrate dehydrogenase-like beta-hydroxyacid dehydrogenase
MAIDIKAVGIVGLGLIGTSLAKRLLNAGFAVFGHDVNPERNAALANLGGTAVATLGDMGRTCSAVIISVLSTDQVEAVVAGFACDNPMNLSPGSLVISTSTCDPDRIAALGKRIESKGLRFLSWKS